MRTAGRVIAEVFAGGSAAGSMELYERLVRV